ncbi:MAG: peptidase S8 [Armatimonadetes bacterium]|nr:peptidase S8 [Armatimonadota bacterium]
MRRLLALLWRVFSLMGLALSLRRFWRTLTDPEERPEVRFSAAGVLLVLAGLLIWSLFGGFRTGRVAAEPLAAAAVPPVSQIVVDFRDRESYARIDALGRDLGLRFRPNSPLNADERLMVADTPGLGAAQRERLVEELRLDPDVEAAEDNFYMTALGDAAPAFTPNDPRYPEQWNFQLINMPAAWEKADGKGAVVAVIDTGVAFEKEKDIPTASDLKDTAYTKPYDFITHKAKAYDDHGHGTHVTGTIAQSTNNKHGVAGIAFKATIMPLKVLTGQGYGNVSDIADAVRYAADNGANVINMSLGGPTSSAVLRKACTYAHQKGVTIVCAAGNGGREGVGYPAAYPECIAVSAVGPSGELTFYSSWGKEVAIAAPGGEYRSPEDRQNGVLQNTIFNKQDVFEQWQGTSMASPHVAGVAALLVSQGLKGPETIRQRLASTATKKGDPKKYGAGLLNAAAAVGAKDAGASVRVVGRVPRWPLVSGLVLGLLVLSGLGLGSGRTRELLGAAPVAWALWHLGGGVAACVAWPAAALVLLFGVRGLRPWLTALLLGWAVGCVALAWSAAGSAAWLLGNGLLALGLAKLAARGR